MIALGEWFRRMIGRDEPEPDARLVELDIRRERLEATLASLEAERRLRDLSQRPRQRQTRRIAGA